jgi:hypothetical protein
VLLADVLLGFMVRTRTLWNYLQRVSNGMSRKAAWERAQSAFSLESGYRLWQRLSKAQSRISSFLCRERPPPYSSVPDPLFHQMPAHLRIVFPSDACPFSSFQNRFQTPLLG